MISITYRVAGMTCEHCVNAVSAEVARIDRVTRVDVDLTTGEVAVTSDAPVADTDVRLAVEEAGYTVLGHGVAS